MSYKKSGQKQKLRDLIYNYFVSAPPKVAGRPYHVLTLPGTPGLQEPRSLERLLRAGIPNLILVGVEHSANSSDRTWEWERVFNLHRRHQGLLSSLFYQDIGDYYRTPTVYPLDLVFEDRCGGATRPVLRSWHNLFTRNLLSDGAYVALTLNHSPRIRHVTVSKEHVFKHIGKICKQNGLGLEILEHFPYDNKGANAYAQPMSFSLLRVKYQ